MKANSVKSAFTVVRPRIVLGLATATLGILCVIPGIHATEPVRFDATNNAIDEPFASEAIVSLRVPLQNDENFSFGAVTETYDDDIARTTQGDAESARELNRKLTNPVSSIWAIQSQFNNFEPKKGHWNNNWLFQPVLPVSLTKDLNLITRPVMPFYNIVPHETAPRPHTSPAKANGSSALARWWATSPRRTSSACSHSNGSPLPG